MNQIKRLSSAAQHSLMLCRCGWASDSLSQMYTQQKRKPNLIWWTWMSNIFWPPSQTKRFWFVWISCPRPNGLHLCLMLSPPLVCALYSPSSQHVSVRWSASLQVRIVPHDWSSLGPRVLLYAWWVCTIAWAFWHWLYPVFWPVFCLMLLYCHTLLIDHLSTGVFLKINHDFTISDLLCGSSSGSSVKRVDSVDSWISSR